MVADAGVLLEELACDCLRLLERGSGVLAKTWTSSSTDCCVGKRTVVKILGPVALAFCDVGFPWDDSPSVLPASAWVFSVLRLEPLAVADFGYGANGDGVRCSL